eukprot:15350347-Ditylum_brightwellii.AAC.1
MEAGNWMVNIGSTNTYHGKYLMEDDTTAPTEDETELLISSSDDSSVDSESTGAWDKTDVPDIFMDGQLDLDEIMVSAAHARLRKNITADYLSKIWYISTEGAERTPRVTSQHEARNKNHSLSKNFSSNYHSIWYKRIKEYFFMDIFCATKKCGKSMCSNTCCPLFVTDTGFVYVVPMRK